MELKGRVAIVTGAVGAIGHGIWKTLAGEGMRVAVADLVQDQCNRFADELETSGGTAMGVAVDVASGESARHQEYGSDCPRCFWPDRRAGQQRRDRDLQKCSRADTGRLA